MVYTAIIGDNPPETIDSAELSEVYRDLYPATGEELVLLFTTGTTRRGPLGQHDAMISSDDQAVYHVTEICDEDGNVIDTVAWDRAIRF